MKKQIAIFLSAISLLSWAGFTACATEQDGSDTAPIAYELEDFSFALAWNIYGISSYDSQTGTLIKTKDAPNPEEFSTTYTLTELEVVQIYEIIQQLNVNDYPDKYSPSKYGSDPSLTLILTVRNGEEVKTITAMDVPYYTNGKDEQAQNFLTACKQIVDILEATDAWKALPDYPYLYE